MEIKVVIYLKNHKNKKVELKRAQRNNVRKSKTGRSKKTNAKYTKKGAPKKPKKQKHKQKKVVETRRANSRTTPDNSKFCGFYGKPVDTPFCKNCGNKFE